MNSYVELDNCGQRKGIDSELCSKQSYVIVISDSDSDTDFDSDSDSDIDSELKPKRSVHKTTACLSLVASKEDITKQQQQNNDNEINSPKTVDRKTQQCPKQADFSKEILKPVVKSGKQNRNGSFTLNAHEEPMDWEQSYTGSYQDIRSANTGNGEPSKSSISLSSSRYLSNPYHRCTKFRQNINKTNRKNCCWKAFSRKKEFMVALNKDLTALKRGVNYTDMPKIQQMSSKKATRNIINNTKSSGYFIEMD